MRLVTARESAEQATKIFRTFEEGDPDLADLGIPEVMKHIGGMFPGNMIGVAARQNVGKSSLILSMAMTSNDKIGVIELEDGPDVWGARILAWHTGIKPTDIRKKTLTAEQVERLREAKADKTLKGPVIAYAIGGHIDDIKEATKRLVKAGCRVVILNYLQKSRGHHSDRRVEVGNTMNAFLQAAAPRDDEDYPGAVPVLVSQLIRGAPDKEPYPSQMKESGDIEAECRLIVMMWRDPKNPLTMRCKVAKSSFGGGGLRFSYHYDKAERLVSDSDIDSLEDFEGEEEGPEDDF